jgi:ATP-dependent Clp protease protease subunit
MKRRLEEIYVRHTGQNRDMIEKTLDRDHFLTAEDAKKFGLIDSVIDKRPVDETAAKT